MLGDPKFADFSQQIGLASLGASDEQIKKLAACYWFSVEFGVIQPKLGEFKAYGAGCLSSAEELKNCTSGDIEYVPFEPEIVCDLEYPDQTTQPRYMFSESLEEAKNKMKEYTGSMLKPVHISWDKTAKTLKIHQKIKT